MRQPIQRSTLPAVRVTRAYPLVLLSLLLVAPSALVAAESTYRLNFDAVKDGELPDAWRPDATHPSEALAQWKIISDPQAPSAPAVLSITRINDSSRGVFNLFWTRQIQFQDGELEVKVRANSGRIDQGGGLIWRAQDANNYYIARYNPLENNFRLYHVKDGRRKRLASAEGLKVASGEWFQLRIVHQGQRIQGWLNGAMAWDIKDDTFLEAGGVGFWSKADAASSFDDFRLRRIK